MPKPQRHVLVCLNSRPPENAKGACSEKGSEAVFKELQRLAKGRGLAGHVMVSRTGCLKHCSRGAVVAVHPDNVWYAGVTLEDAAEICDSHLVGGVPVSRLLMPDIPWE
jgi:(2Fe-2S) ferredoxin/predicted nucleic acid-binding Zn ribbon protein